MKRSASLLMITLFSTIAFAESKTFPNMRAVYTRAEYQPHAGLLVGTINPKQGDISNEFGLDVGFQPYIPFGVGAEITRTDDRSIVLVKGSYNFGGILPVIQNAFVGVAAGQDDSVAVYGPLVGFDIPLAKDDGPTSQLTLGASAKYLFSSDDDAQAFSASANMKYWF